MDKREAILIASQYVALVKKIYPISKAYLFGSFAKGTNDSDSDIDIALILDEADDIMDAQVGLMKLRRSIDLRIEPHPFVFMDFDKANPTAFEIMQNGIELK
ncbi:Nucleotidyltransferase domain-containing protein [Dyadobacter soli]|uniref:Nucleotidyltransferase domain-containing protein n=1 Tax=Dyadobacter soli TaxID=659014 RepID=A0A1G7ITN2_9BACT|nr:nucleotidyltransferase domain-containing protein [Dyadobacter soli]SDF16060.1 Nucleotidyltransferase domain-containing protein [Dyadobacter soli]